MVCPRGALSSSAYPESYRLSGPVKSAEAKVNASGQGLLRFTWAVDLDRGTRGQDVSLASANKLGSTMARYEAADPFFEACALTPGPMEVRMARGLATQPSMPRYLSSFPAAC